MADTAPINVKEELFSRIQSMWAATPKKPATDMRGLSGLLGAQTARLFLGEVKTPDKSCDDDEGWVVADETNPEGVTSEKSFDDDTKLFQEALSKECIDIQALKVLASSRVVPLRYRGAIWKLFLGYLPPRPSEWKRSVSPLRLRYAEKKNKFLEDYPKFESWSKARKKLFKEISVDIPRTYLNGFKEMCRDSKIAPVITRLIFIWSSENTISYYPGMCELVYMLFFTFLAEHPCTGNSIQGLRALDLTALEQKFLDNVEADVFYCFDSLMSFLKSVFTDDVMQGACVLVGEISKNLEIFSRTLLHTHTHLKLSYTFFCFLAELSSHLNFLCCSPLDFSIRWIVKKNARIFVCHR